MCVGMCVYVCVCTCVCVYPDLSRLRGMTPGDSEAGTVSVSVTGVVAVVVSSRDELMKEVVLEAEGLVVTGVWASISPPSVSPSHSGSDLTPGHGPVEQVSLGPNAHFYS